MKYPAIDIFAGSGGLGEGFAASGMFDLKLSVEQDLHACRTLETRSLYRKLHTEKTSGDYYRYLTDTEYTRERFFEDHEEFALEVLGEVWRTTLGNVDEVRVKHRISRSLSEAKKWVLIGGPPCQAYSLAGRSRRVGDPSFKKDKKHTLYLEYLKILANHAPPVFLMENVKGLLSSRYNGSYIFEKILADLKDPGEALGRENQSSRYRLFPLGNKHSETNAPDAKDFLVRCEDYGIPQTRHRVFILGIREDLDVAPAKYLKPFDKHHPVEQMIDDLPAVRSKLSKGPDNEEIWKNSLSSILDYRFLNNGQITDIGNKISGIINDISGMQFDRVDVKRLNINDDIPEHLRNYILDGNLSTPPNHEPRGHMIQDLHRYLFLSTYAEVNGRFPRLGDIEFPKELYPEHKNATTGKFNDRFRVQLSDRPSTTITSHISKDGHYYIHYDPRQCRSLTVREAARLQTFPDNYFFEGPRTSQYHQVGNAVPPYLAIQAADIVNDILGRI